MRNRIRTAAPVLFRILACWAIVVLASAHAADPPRRIAVVPFTVIGQEDVRPVAALLPRLLASRLMALAGVDAPVLAPADKTPVDAAKEANAPLLLQGTVSRLGKGYSIDVAVTDAATGKTAGSFFASAATEDEIIPQIGRLAEDISEKLFDVKPAYRPPVATPAATPAGASFSGAPPAAFTGTSPAGTQQQGSGGVAPAGAAWAPSRIKKLGQSDKVNDELFGVVSLAAEANGDGELVAWGKNTLYFYRVKGGVLTPWTRTSRELYHHFLGVDVIDLDGDGKNEILVTDRVNERIESFVLGRKGDAYEEIAEKLPFYFAVLADRKGRRVPAGQYAGLDTAFQGKFLTLQWVGGTLKEGEPLPMPATVLPMASGGILGLSAAKLGDDDRFLYSEEAGHLRILDEAGKTISKGKAKFGWGGDSFEWGPYIPIEGRRAQVKVRQSPRILPGSPGAPMLLAVQMKSPGILTRISGGDDDGSRLALFKWDDGEFVERAVSPYTDFQVTGADLLSTSGVGKGARVVASVIEQAAGIYKDRISRLVLFGFE